MRRTPWVIAALAGAATLAAWVATMPELPAPSPPDAGSPAPVHGYEIIRAYPHDPGAYTQGLIHHEGFLYESTGRTGRSTLRKVRLETGEVVQRRDLDARYFGEGLTEWGGRLLQLTPIRTEVSIPGALEKMDDPSSAWPELGRKFGVNVGSAYDDHSLEPLSTFTYDSEGWGLTRDERRLILSDGSSILRFLDPESFHETDRIRVTDAGRSIVALNELEFVRGKLYANVWQTNLIAIINPDSGQVTGWIDLTGLAERMTPAPDPAGGAVLNGIAYDPGGDRLFVTGKLWPRLFEIRIH